MIGLAARCFPGHEGTVWCVEFEGVDRIGALTPSHGLLKEQKDLLDLREKAGPRLISCSDDCTIRIWRRVPRVKQDPPTGQGRMPSIWKNRDFEEEWVEETRLPQVHERPVYSVGWSKKTGRVVSTGSDGKIVVYEERWKHAESSPEDSSGDVQMADGTHAPKSEAAEEQQVNGDMDKMKNDSITEWKVVAEIDNAHDVFEINHVVWAPRADKAKRTRDEEVMVSTGDDGEVKVWTLEE